MRDNSYETLFQHFARKNDTYKGVLKRIEKGKESAEKSGLGSLWESFAKEVMPEYCVHRFLRKNALPEIYQGVLSALLYDSGDFTCSVFDVEPGAFVLRDGRIHEGFGGYAKSTPPIYGWEPALDVRSYVTPNKIALNSVPELLVQLAKETKRHSTYKKGRRYLEGNSYAQVFIPSHAPAKVKKSFEGGRVITMETDHVLLFREHPETTGRLIAPPWYEYPHISYGVQLYVKEFGILLYEAPFAVGWGPEEAACPVCQKS